MSSPREPDILIYLDDELLGTVTLDALQDDFPWYSGTLAEGPGLPRWRDFVDRFAEVDFDIPYTPHHPAEGPYEETDLAVYVGLLRELCEAKKRGDAAPAGSEEHPWVEPWLEEPVERLEHYLAFVDWRRWRVVTAEGVALEGVPLPPDLHFSLGRFSFRP